MDLTRHIVRKARHLAKRAVKPAMALVTRFVRPLGYEVVQRKLLSLDERSALAAPDTTFYRQWCTSAPIWTPWLADPEFRSVYERIAQHTIVPPDHCYVLWCLARQAFQLSGDFAECGVYRGGSALLLASLLRGRGRTLHLFDSFEGLPDPDPAEDNVTTFESGTFRLTAPEVAEVRRLLSQLECDVDLHQGWIPKTFTGLEDRRFSLVHVDVDFYRPTLHTCGFFYPRLVAGGVLLFDEYGFATTRSEKRAVDEFFSDKPETPLPLRTGQAIIVKLPRGQAT